MVFPLPWIRQVLILKRHNVALKATSTSTAPAVKHSCSGVVGCLLTILSRLLPRGRFRFSAYNRRVLLLLTCCVCVHFSILRPSPKKFLPKVQPNLVPNSA